MNQKTNYFFYKAPFYQDRNLN